MNDEALAVGLKSYLATLKDRLERIQQRSNNRRQIARDAMIEVEFEEDCGARFHDFAPARSGRSCRHRRNHCSGQVLGAQPPRLNRIWLLSDLKDGATVPGAAMSNLIPVLSVRTR